MVFNKGGGGGRVVGLLVSVRFKAFLSPAETTVRVAKKLPK